MKNTSPDQSDLQRNNLMSLGFLNDSPSWLRDHVPFIFPKGRKAVSISVQTHQGWAVMRGDPNVGFDINHSATPSRSSGRWLRGPLSPRSCLSDVVIARTLMGWRRWHVSTQRVWAYRVVAGSVLALLAGNHSPALAAVVFIVPFLVPSPATPAGLYKYAELRGFLPPALRPDVKQPVAPPVFSPLEPIE